MDLHLKGRRALVTGATAGIGRQIALTLAEEGAAVAIVGRRDALLEEVAAQARAAQAVLPVVPIALDMTEPGAPEHVARVATQVLGNVDILVNAMGASSTIGWDASEDAWEVALTLNWTRLRQLTTQLLPGMRERKWGRVINITGGNETTGLNAAAVAKAAVHAWAKGLSDLVAPDGITVNSIGPGKIDSEQMRRLYTPERRALYSQANIPMGRFGEPGELADLAVFLASPRASYITGSVMHVDGGLRRYMY